MAAFTRVRKTGPFIGFIGNLVLRTLRRHSSALTASSLAPSVAAASATSGRLPALDHTATRAAFLPSPALPTLVAAAPPSPSPSHRPPLPAWSPFRCCCCRAADLASLAVASVVSGVPPSPLHSPAARLRFHTPSVAICCRLPLFCELHLHFSRRCLCHWSANHLPTFAVSVTAVVIATL